MIPLRSKHFQAAYSLPEIMVTIAVIAVMASVAIAAFGNVNEGAQRAQAERLTAKLNAGLKGFGQSNWDITTARNDSSTTDELLVVRSLQYKPGTSSSRFDAGAPYCPPTWNPIASSTSSDFRVRWNGKNFQLLCPGSSGTGLKLSFDGSDQGESPTFAANYKPEGAK